MTATNGLLTEILSTGNGHDWVDKWKRCFDSQDSLKKCEDDLFLQLIYRFLKGTFNYCNNNLQLNKLPAPESSMVATWVKGMYELLQRLEYWLDQIINGIEFYNRDGQHWQNLLRRIENFRYSKDFERTRAIATSCQGFFVTHGDDPWKNLPPGKKSVFHRRYTSFKDGVAQLARDLLRIIYWLENNVLNN